MLDTQKPLKERWFLCGHHWRYCKYFLEPWGWDLPFPHNLDSATKLPPYILEFSPSPGQTLLCLPPSTPPAPQHTPFINRTCDDVVSLLWMMVLACLCLTKSLPYVNKSYAWELGAQEMTWQEEKCLEGCVCCGAPIMTSRWLQLSFLDILSWDTLFFLKVTIRFLPLFSRATSESSRLLQALHCGLFPVSTSGLEQLSWKQQRHHKGLLGHHLSWFLSCRYCCF